MPKPSPVDSITSRICTSSRWKNWSGYRAVCSFEESSHREYFAIRHGVGLIDISPLYKYKIIGREACDFLSFITVRDLSFLKVGRVTYLCWCDTSGKVLDDGTVSRISEDEFWLTAADPSFFWLNEHAKGFFVSIEDISSDIACLSLQGPQAKELLLHGSSTSELNQLKFFGQMNTQIFNHKCSISRTGYTGDLGYEVWIGANDAAPLYEKLLNEGFNYGLRPVGLDAMDITRIEAGFIMNGVDYFSANHCLIESRKSTPYELGLGWCVNLERPDFIGRDALVKAKKDENRFALVGIETSWEEAEKLFNQYNLPPCFGAGAWRDGRPIYNDEGDFIGKGTSGSFSPTLKKDICLASVPHDYDQEGKEIQIEITVECERHKVLGTIRKLPFLELERKKS